MASLPDLAADDNREVKQATDDRAIQSFNIQFPVEIWAMIVREVCDPLTEEEMLCYAESFLRSIRFINTCSRQLTFYALV